jgi:GNAT superfamily N-acetyltransferase
VAGVIEVIPGTVDTEGFARIYSEVGRWTTLTPERIEHERRTHSSLRDWLALVDGEPVGAAVCVETPDMRESPALYGGVRVLAGSRRQGVGSELFRVLSEYARTLGKSELEVFAYEDDPDGVAFAERRGFTTVMRLRMLRLALAGLPPPPVDPPEGVTIATLAERPELERGLWEVACESMPDMPYDGDAPVHPGTLEEFRAAALSGPAFIPEATFLALSAGDVIGFAQLSWEDRDRGIAFHSMLGVRRAERGRGIAGALKAVQIAWAVENGLTELRTGNEERNAPARAVNARYPYEPIPDGILLRGPLASST